VAKIVTGDVIESVSLSHKGKVYGTPAYMAPEQFSGGVSDPRVDLYAIGCIAYTLLVGEPPFSGHMLQLLEAHATRQPERPSSKRSSARIPGALDDIVLRLLAKRAAERFQTGRELFQALERLAEREERTPSGRRTHPSRAMRVVRRDEVGATDFSHSQPKPDVPDGGAATDQVSSAGVFERALKEVVRSLAQAIADLDDAPVPVLIALMRLRQLDDDLAFVEERQHAHEALSDDLDSAARSREGSLRFALGELHYHKAAAVQRGATPDPAIDAHIARVEAQVAKVHEKLDGEQTLVTDSSIALAAERHTCEEELAAGYRALERLVDQYLPRVESNPQVAPLAGRLRSIRAASPKKR
jgi:hypothetical protein